MLPADGSAHGFDKNSDALDISHVNLAKYVEAADKTLDMAIATQAERAAKCESVRHLAGQELRVRGHRADGRGRCPAQGQEARSGFPPAGGRICTSTRARTNGSASSPHGSSVGVFRHEDESFNPYFIDFATIYPGRYRVPHLALELEWDKGRCFPRAAPRRPGSRWCSSSEDGRGGGHPSNVLGYYDAPSLESKVHEWMTWLNSKEIIGFNAASLAPGANYTRKDRAMGFTGPGIACDWLDVEGPLHDVWPPRSHRLLFGDLPLAEFKPAEQPGVRFARRDRSARKSARQESSRPGQPASGPSAASSRWPTPTACSPRSCRGPSAARSMPSVGRITWRGRRARCKAGDCFESACAGPIARRSARRIFFTTSSQPGQLDDHALACRAFVFLLEVDAGRQAQPTGGDGQSARADSA